MNPLQEKRVVAALEAIARELAGINRRIDQISAEDEENQDGAGS